MYARIVPTVATSSVYLSKFISGSQEKWVLVAVTKKSL